MKPGDLGRYWRTARHMRPLQAGYWLDRRVVKPARRAVAARASVLAADVSQDSNVSLRQLSSLPSFPEWQPETSRRIIQHREFQFLNQSFSGSAEIPWPGGEFGRLWDYQLHYFDYINLDLTSPADEQLLLAALTIVSNWIDCNSWGQPPGWEPYPLSLRIVNWLKFLVRHAKRLEETGQAERVAGMLASLAAQIRALEATLEKDVLTNHLLKNIKALVFTGALLEAAESHCWLNHGLKLLKREIQEQILEDGGHFQRSPMYHAQVLEDLLDLDTVMTACPLSAAESQSEIAAEVAKKVRDRIIQMSAWLEAVLHPDDEIPLLNDSAFGMNRSLRDVLRRAGNHGPAKRPDVDGPIPDPIGVQLLRHSGYATIRHEPSRSWLVFDCGPLGPAYQPGHGHCDLLSFELSLHGMRVVVDTGTSTYEAGSVRSHERSTAAHNTLRIGGEEQAEIWSSFRVGRRPRVRGLTAATHSQLCFVQGQYSAVPRSGVTHSRAVVRDAGGVWWIVDLLKGRGEHSVESFIHFHPQIKVKRVKPAANSAPVDLREQAELDFAGHRYRLFEPEAVAFSLAESWYSPEFGLRLANTVASWKWRGRLPVMFASALAPGEGGIPAVHLSPERGCCWIDNVGISLH